MDFPDVQSHEEANFLAPSFQVMHHEEERQIRREYMQMSICQANEAAMAEFRPAHPSHVAAQVEFYPELAT